VVVLVFIARIISKVRKELSNLSFCINGELEVVKYLNDFAILTLEGENESYIIYFYEKGDSFKLVSVQKEMEKYGIEKGFVMCTNKIVVMKNFKRTGIHVAFDDNLLEHEIVVKNIAKWYKKLHSMTCDNLGSYNDYFSLKNIRFLMSKLNVKNNAFFDYVITNFENIKLKLSRVPQSVICLDFPRENIFFSKFNYEMVVFGIDELYEGFRCADIDFIISLVGEKYRSIFEEAYGKINDEERLINEVVGCVIKLYLASKKEVFPDWSKEYLIKINKEELLTSAKELVEWY